MGTVCGFEVWQDKLRIPSTKRVCLIGQERTYRASESPQIFLKIDEFVRRRTNTITKAPKNLENDTNWENLKIKKSKGENSVDTLWTENFKAREAVQPVRNCTQLENSIREDLVSTVAKMLLEKKHIVEVIFLGCNYIFGESNYCIDFSVYSEKKKKINQCLLNTRTIAVFRKESLTKNITINEVGITFVAQ